MRLSHPPAWAVLIAAIAAIAAFGHTAGAQQIPKPDRETAETMLRVIASDIRKHYYDPKMHGVDWDAKVVQTKDAIDKAPSMNMALSQIAALIDLLNDSHTFMLPPEHSYRHDYGFAYEMLGNQCVVHRVRPHSDAEAKGVNRGDQLLAINGLTPSRDVLWKLQYLFGRLRPQPVLHLQLRGVDGQMRQLDVAAKIHQRKRVTDLTFDNGGIDLFNIIREEEGDQHLMRLRYAEFGDDLLIVKFPEFAFDVFEVQTMIDKARKHKALIVDLRENGGGNVDTLKYMLGGFFDHEVKIADRVQRRESKPQIAKPRHHVFEGKLMVLVDSESASASELFARVMQIEKRGVVLGDHSSGRVMEAMHYQYQLGATAVIFYGASITDADLIMTDGKSLEHVGVEPDKLLIPSVGAIATGHDPVLAYAAGQVGVKIDPAEAGKLFPYEWPPTE